MAAEEKKKTYTILVVDDEEDLREIILSQLELLEMDRPVVLESAETAQRR